MGLSVGCLWLLLPFGPADPSTAAEWKTAGTTHMAARHLEAAAAAFEKACDLAPRDEDACYYFARTLFALDRWEKARKPFEQALSAASEPKLARVHRAMALNFIALGNAAEAEQHFRRAIALNPGPVLLLEDPRVDYGAFLFREGRLQEAIAPLQDAAKAVPDSARAWTELGRVLLHVGKPEQATVNLEKAVKLEPNSSLARLLLGRAYLQAGRIEDGQRQLHLAGKAGKSEDSSIVR